jgi:nucleotide-binding universal stress UspA family protein
MTKMYKKILVPLDGSKTAEIALPHAESLATRYNAQLLLLSVINPPAIAGRDSPSVDVIQQQINVERQDAALYLKGLKGEFAEKKIKAEAMVTFGPTVEAIIHVAETHAPDLVLIASHGRTGLKRVFFGSTAAGILNRIDQPLMVIRRPEED